MVGAGCGHTALDEPTASHRHARPPHPQTCPFKELQNQPQDFPSTSSHPRLPLGSRHVDRAAGRSLRASLLSRQCCPMAIFCVTRSHGTQVGGSETKTHHLATLHDAVAIVNTPCAVPSLVERIRLLVRAWSMASTVDLPLWIPGSCKHLMTSMPCGLWLVDGRQVEVCTKRLLTAPQCPLDVMRSGKR